MIAVFMIVLTWLGYLFALIGFTATVWKSLQKWRSLRSFSWKEFEKYSKRLIKLITEDGYYPNVIVTIGRGGAILGSVLSGNLPKEMVCEDKGSVNVPILGLDRIYRWHAGERIEVPNDMVDLTPLNGKKILLVAGDILTGGTMEVYRKQIQGANPEEIRTASLVKGITSAFLPTYFGREIPGDFRMPWMYKGHSYARDSRNPSGKPR